MRKNGKTEGERQRTNIYATKGAQSNNRYGSGLFAYHHCFRERETDAFSSPREKEETVAGGYIPFRVQKESVAFASNTPSLK